MTITYKNVVEHLTRTYPTPSKQLKKMTEIIDNIDDLERVRHEMGEY